LRFLEKSDAIKGVGGELWDSAGPIIGVSFFNTSDGRATLRTDGPHDLLKGHSTYRLAIRLTDGSHDLRTLFERRKR